MAGPYNFRIALVTDILPGGGLRTLRNGTITIKDSADDSTVTTVTTDHNGGAVFQTASAGTVYYVTASGYVSGNIISPDAYAESASAAASAASSAADAAASAQAAIDASNLVGAPADTAVNTLVTPGSGSATEATLNATYGTKAEVAGKVDKALAGIVTPSTVSVADLQAAADAAASDGTRFVAAGVVTTSATLTITSDCDLSGLTINYTGTGTAVRVGDGTVLRRKRFVLPAVVEANKPTTGWNAGTVGVKLDTLSDCKITLNNVQNFETGVLCYGTSNEFSYNEVHVAGLNNNKRNLYLDADATGWVNQNVFVAGRYSHNSSEGAQVAGCYHVYLADVVTSRPNGNVWVGASLESPNVVQYAVNAESGQYNLFSGCRWEDTSGAARVRWGAKAVQNMIIGGYLADAIVYTKVLGAARNLAFTSDRQIAAGAGNPMWQLENLGSSSNAALALYNAGTIDAPGGYSPTADWVVALAATFIKMKNKADTQARVQIDQAGIGAGGGMQFGSGSAAPDVKLGRAAAGVLAVDAGNVFKTGRNTTANRPSAAASGAGAMFYDTTLNKPIWSDGTNWRDATGTVV